MASKTFMVLGDPISHSLSPRIHKAAYEVLELDWDYEAKQVSSGQLENFLSTTTAGGFSITMPLKEEAAKLASSLDKNAKLTSVANTLVRSGDGFAGYNTDVFGIAKSVEPFIKSGVEVVSLLGAGATAKSALVAIASLRPNALFDIYLRDQTKAHSILELAGELEVFTSIHSLEEFSNFQDLTINTLPNGASDVLPVSSQKGYLLNVNYAGSDEKLLGSFNSSRVVTGQNMLVWQAIQQIRLFMGNKPEQPLENEDAVLKAMFAAL